MLIVRISAPPGRLWRLASALAMALSLAGCFYQSSRVAAAHDDANAAFAQCERLRQAGRYTTYRAAVECAVPKVVDAYQAAAYPYPDLVILRINARRLGADRVDAGQVTQAQYEHDVAELETRVLSEEARRAASTDRGNTPAPVPEETLLAGLPSFVMAPQAETAAPGACVPLGAIRPCK
jgi:hypothetical protein